MELTITVVGLMTLLIAVLGVAFKLFAMVRSVRTEVENHMSHKLDQLRDEVIRLENKVDDQGEKLNQLIGKLS